MNHKDSWITRCVPECFLRRNWWSRVVPQENMIRYCLVECGVMPVHKFPGNLLKHGIIESIKLVLYVSSSEVITEVHKKFIYDELKRKSMKASNAKDAVKACSQRGYAALLQSSSTYIKNVENLLLWHLAIELHLQEDPKANQGDERRICKLLSDYMFYLLVKTPVMLAPVLGNWDVVFGDTCAEAKRIFNKHKVTNYSEACTKIIFMKPKLRSAVVKQSRRKSVLFDVCILVQQLRTENDHWKLMS